MPLPESDALLSLSLILLGGLAGFVDSIAGGGGLITLPSISLVLGPGPLAIGTNKICGFAAALIALLVYIYKGHFDWQKSISFTIAVGVGAVLGSKLTPLLPAEVFPWFLVITCPGILYIIWRKDWWVEHDQQSHEVRSPAPWWQPTILLSGLACGLYDGMWGPGGGTFMFLSLLFIARMPLLNALATAKLANAASALTALTSYAIQGYVHPREGVLVAIGAIVGGFVGARLATVQASRIVRPVLVGVVALLVVKLLTDYVYAV
jgi:uncharacterized membrane protein YfcA